MRGAGVVLTIYLEVFQAVSLNSVNLNCYFKQVCICLCVGAVCLGRHLIYILLMVYCGKLWQTGHH